MKIEITKTISIDGKTLIKAASAEITDEQARDDGFIRGLQRELFEGLREQPNEEISKPREWWLVMDANHPIAVRNSQLPPDSKYQPRVHVREVLP